MKNKKIIRIWGGLGNQLFQYAFAKFLEKKFNYSISLNINWYSNQTYRNFNLEKLINIEYEIVNRKDKFLDKVLNYKLEKFYKNLMKKNIMLYPKCLIGYWQDQDFAKFLKRENFKKNFFKSENCVTEDDYYILHFRGGDFYNSKDHVILDYNYYKEALNFFDNKKIVCLSDDNERLIYLIKKLKLKNYIIPDLDEIETFELICNSKGGIASNSTYCWWGAYLSHSRNWVFPKKWLKNKTLISENLYIKNTLIL